MATAFAPALRAAGQYASPAVAVTRLQDRDVAVQATGMLPADLADPDLVIEQYVQANDSDTAGTGWYIVYGPDAWSGGGTGKDGLPIQPGFAFHASDIPATAQRLRMAVVTNKDATWGFDVTAI